MSDVRVDLAEPPAGWATVVSPPVHLLVRLDPGDPLVQQCRDAAARGLDSVLDVLLRSRGLADLPDFAAADTRGDRVLARGAACVDVRGSGPSGVVRSGREPWRDAPLVDSVESVVLYAVTAGEAPPLPSAAAASAEPARAGRVVPVPDARRLPDPDPGLDQDPDEGEVEVEVAEPDPGRTLDPEAFEQTQPPPVHTRSWSDGASKRVPAAEAGSGSATPDAGGPPPLIDSVPWRSGTGSAWRPDPAPESPAAPARPAPPTPPTVPAAPPPAPHSAGAHAAALGAPGVPSFAGADPAPPDPDHTTDRSSLPQLEGPASGPVVIGVRCPRGHPSPPMAARCRTCGAVVPPQDPAPVPRPPLGVLRLSTGDQVSLDRGVLLGRSPRVTEDLPAQDRPHQLRLPSPENDLSRNHVEVVLDGWQVLVRDLGSTNGTMVTLPGTQPVQLRPHDLQVIEPGTVVSLSPEVTFVFEATP